MKKLLTLIIAVVFTLNATGPGYALRPLSEVNSRADRKAAATGDAKLRDFKRTAKNKKQTELQRKIAKLKKAQQVMETYANWRFRDYENNVWYHVNVLKKETGQRLLERIREKRRMLIAQGTNSVSMSAVNRLVSSVPSIKTPHTELFIDILPGISQDKKRQLLKKQMVIMDWYGNAFIVQIGRGCYNQCTFCQFEAPSHMCFMPFPILIKILDECRELMLETGDQIVLHRDNDCFHYRDFSIGANFADVFDAVKKRGFEYGLLTNGWNENDKVAQESAERMAKGKDMCDISFNLYKRGLESAVMEKRDAVRRGDRIAITAAQAKIDRAYERIKRRYRNVLVTLRPILDNIQLEFVERKRYSLINKLTRRMYNELCEELKLDDIPSKDYRMGLLPDNERQERDYDFLEKEETRGYFIFRPYGDKIEVGYTGPGLISLKRLAESGILSKEDLAFLINMAKLLHKKHYRNVVINIQSLPETMQSYLHKKGIKRKHIRLLDFDIAERRFLKEVYSLYYPQFIAYLELGEEVTSDDIDGILNRFGDIPIMNGVKCGGKNLITNLWLRNRNQELASELVLFETRQPITPVLPPVNKAATSKAFSAGSLTSFKHEAAALKLLDSDA